MTDKITIERETLQKAIDALECSLSDSRPYIVKSRESAAALRAALEVQPAEPVALDDALRWSKATESHGAYVFTPAQLRVFYKYATRAAPPATKE